MATIHRESDALQQHPPGIRSKKDMTVPCKVWDSETRYLTACVKVLQPVHLLTPFQCSSVHRFCLFTLMVALQHYPRSRMCAFLRISICACHYYLLPRRAFEDPNHGAFEGQEHGPHKYRSSSWPCHRLAHYPRTVPIRGKTSFEWNYSGILGLKSVATYT